MCILGSTFVNINVVLLTYVTYVHVAGHGVEISVGNNMCRGTHVNMLVHLVPV